MRPLARIGRAAADPGWKLAAAAALGAGLLSGCAAPGWEASARQAAHHLDAVEQDIEEYGTITASAAALVRDPGERFKFDLDLSAREVFDARKKAEAFSLAVDMFALDAAVAANADVVPSGAPAAPAAPALPNADAAKGVLPSPKFSEPLPRPDPASLAVNFRQLIQLASDDHTTLRLLELLCNPNDTRWGDNKVVFAAVMTVALRPGRRTYTGYVGELDVRVEYAAKREDGQVVRGTGHPLAFAVFPFLDAQVVDERTSIRRQVALATLLSISAPKLSAAEQTALVKRLERDAASATTLNTVAAYNATGRHFGWRFSPRFVAQGDPAAQETSPANLLQPQSFPALVLIIADKKDLGAPNQAVLKCADRAPGPYDQLMFHVTHKWLRAPAPETDRLPIPFAAQFDRLFHPRQTMADQVEWAIQLDLASEAAVKVKSEHPRQDRSYTFNSLADRVNSLEAASIGATTYWDIPDQAAARAPAFAFSSLQPRQGWTDTDSWFVATGRGFKNGETTFVIGGVQGDQVSISAGGQSAIFRIPSGALTRPDLPLDAAVFSPSADGGATIKDAVTFRSRTPPPPAAAAPPASRVTVRWDTSNPPRILSIETDGNVTAAEVFEAVMRPPPAPTKK